MPDRQPRTDWSKAPTLFIPRPQCPYCGHGKYDRSRTTANGDGTTTKLCRCRSCGKPYTIVDEIPESGIETLWPL